VITIHVAEADDAEREHRRLQLHEPYLAPSWAMSGMRYVHFLGFSLKTTPPRKLLTTFCLE
jgi:hypothetical protein